jgi:SH3 domain-containing YSC84-like protein 1
MKTMRNLLKFGIGIITALFIVSLVLLSYMPARAADDEEKVQGLVDKARITFNDFMRDPNYRWMHENLNRSHGILIFPQVLKGGFIFGGSGGTGVLMVRNGNDWSQPAFYTIGSVTFGLQIGGEASQIAMLAMTPKAIDSLLNSSVRLGGDVSLAIGPVGGGAKANIGIPDVTADFVSFVKSKGLYGGINLEGAVVAVRDSLNTAYYGEPVRPADIIMRRSVANEGSSRLRAALRNATTEFSG